MGLDVSGLTTNSPIITRIAIPYGLGILARAACQQVVYLADLFGMEVTYSGGMISQSAGPCRNWWRP
ncbi:MAG: hypothetical protein QHH07_06585 [Sedimentisphaerales bacterium]|nr:hypothetical protein [Sedimentisphaerales bacterium]